jgi:REP element-mobilizing transposase RayT
MVFLALKGRACGEIDSHARPFRAKFRYAAFFPGLRPGLSWRGLSGLKFRLAAWVPGGPECRFDWIRVSGALTRGDCIMAQSLSNVLLHIVFSTKHRQPFLDEGVERELFKYLATACNTLDCPTHGIGAADDHIHIACSLGRTIAVSKLIQEIKQDSSQWMKSQGLRYSEIAWQNGYGAFSIGQSQFDDLRRYIAGQRQHHARDSFQDEFRRLLKRYRIEYDERYIWD